MQRWRLSLFVFLVALLACERQPPAKAPAAGAVKIVSLSPDTTTPLKVGEKVTLRVEVDYRLSVDAGAVSLVVQSGNTSLAQAMQAVKKGSGRATLTAQFVVPDTSSIQIYAPLQAQGQSATRTVAVRTYKVAAK